MLFSLIISDIAKETLNVVMELIIQNNWLVFIPNLKIAI